MSSKLSVALRRARAIALGAGPRSYYVTPLDRPRGRPRRSVAGYLAMWRKPYREVGDYDSRHSDQMLRDDFLSLIAPDLVDYLHRAGLPSGWFTISERASLLGTPATIRVRDYDVFVTAGSIFGPANSCVLARDGFGEPCRREFVPMVGLAPRQLLHASRIQDVSNFREVVNG